MNDSENYVNHSTHIFTHNLLLPMARLMMLRLSLISLLLINCVKSEDADAATKPKNEGFCHEGNVQNSKSVVCYYAGYLSADKLDPCLCTHLLLTDWKVGPDLKQLSHKRFKRLDFVRSLKARNPNLQIGLVLFGKTEDSIWAELIAKNKQASALAFRTIAFLSEMDLDGIAIDYDPASAERKNNFTALIKSFREALDLSIPTNSSHKRWLMVNVARDFNHIRKAYDFAHLSMLVDLFYLPAYNFTDDSSEEIIHPSPLMGSDGENADSLVDLLLSLNTTAKKIILGLPAFGVFYHLEESASADLVVEDERSFVSYQQICTALKTGDWIVERAEDKTETRALGNLTWVGFDDSASIRIKSKYALLRNLGGVGVWYLDHDDFNDTCGEGNFPLIRAAHTILDELKNADQTRIMRSFEADMDLEEAEAQLSQIAIPRSGRSNGSPFRVTRIIDRTGEIHLIQDPSQTNLVCTRPGFYRIPEDCSRFYRCVKFNQFKDDFVVFEYDCPAGLVFDEKWEVCNWPSASAPCGGSTEIMPVPRNKFVCSSEGYFTDPENCRWFYKCDDFLRDGVYTAFEFRCPFDLAFDESNIMCNWRWLVPGCGKSGHVLPPIGPFGPGQRPGHSLGTSTLSPPKSSRRPGHNIDGQFPSTDFKDRNYPNGPNGPNGPFPNGPAGPNGPFHNGPSGPNGPFPSGPSGPNGPFPGDFGGGNGHGPAGPNGPFPSGPSGPNGPFPGDPDISKGQGPFGSNGVSSSGPVGPNGPFSKVPGGFNGQGGSPRPQGTRGPHGSFTNGPFSQSSGGNNGPGSFGTRKPNSFNGSPGPIGPLGPVGTKRPAIQISSGERPIGPDGTSGPIGHSGPFNSNSISGSTQPFKPQPTQKPSVSIRPNGLSSVSGPNELPGLSGPHDSSFGPGGSFDPNSGFGSTISFKPTKPPAVSARSSSFKHSLEPGRSSSFFDSDGSTGTTGAIGPNGLVGPASSFGPNRHNNNFGPNGPGGSFGPNGPGGSFGPNGPGGFFGPNGPGGSFGSTGPIGPGSSLGPIGPGSSLGPIGPGSSLGPIGPGSSLGPFGTGVSTGPGVSFGSNSFTGSTNSFGPHSVTHSSNLRSTPTPHIRPSIITHSQTHEPHTIGSTILKERDDILTGPQSPREFPDDGQWEPRKPTRRPNAIEGLPIGYIPGRIVGNTQCEKTIEVQGTGESYGQIHVKGTGLPSIINEYEPPHIGRIPNANNVDNGHTTGGPSRQTAFTSVNNNRGNRHFTSAYQDESDVHNKGAGLDFGQIVVRTKWSETTGKTGLTDNFLNDQKNFGFTSSQFSEHSSDFQSNQDGNLNLDKTNLSGEKQIGVTVSHKSRTENHRKSSSNSEFGAVNSWNARHEFNQEDASRRHTASFSNNDQQNGHSTLRVETSGRHTTGAWNQGQRKSTSISQENIVTQEWNHEGTPNTKLNAKRIDFSSKVKQRQGSRDTNEDRLKLNNNFISSTPFSVGSANRFQDDVLLDQSIGSVNRGFTRGPTVILENDNRNRVANEERLSFRWRNVTELVGPVQCNRAGLFRHPDDCSLFYECFWDRWLNKFTIHYFECPVRLAFDFTITGCNWPLKGPHCEHNNK
uniref:Chitinase n=1 Tax=Strigamia maritima TaxID=126957 RepID=T1JDU5_STRMM